MIFKISFTPDEAYYKETYFELAPFKKWEPVLAVLLIVLGGWIYLYDRYEGVVSFFLVVIGVYEFIKCYYEKNKWIKERMESEISGELMEMEFNDAYIKHAGPFSKGEIKWTGFKEIKKTNKGIVFKVETGTSIYL